MKALLRIREPGARAFTTLDLIYGDDYEGNEVISFGEDLARAEGERLCTEGSVEAFEVWTLNATYRREWRVVEDKG